MKGDIWKVAEEFNGFVVIPTNGFVKVNGSCVMGRGLAYQAMRKYPELPKLLGDRIKKDGNVVQILGKHRIITFPVKHNWWERANLELMEKSFRRLRKDIIDIRLIFAGSPVFISHVGCGNGHLDWEKEVQPLMKRYLGDIEDVVICDNATNTVG